MNFPATFVAVFVSVLGIGLAEKALGSLDHLQPEASSLAAPVLDQYDRALDKLFTLEEGEQMVVRVLMRPSFGAERTVGIKCVDSVPEAYYQAAHSSVYRAGMNSHGWSADVIDGVEIERSSFPIDPYTASLVYMAWAGMLLDTRYSEEVRMVVDGTTSLFSSRLGGRGLVSGQTHSPQPETLPGALVELAGAIWRFAEGEEVESDTIASMARDIIDRHGNASRRSVKLLHHDCLPREISLD